MAAWRIRRINIIAATSSEKRSASGNEITANETEIWRRNGVSLSGESEIWLRALAIKAWAQNGA